MHLTKLNVGIHMCVFVRESECVYKCQVLIKELV